MHSVWADLRVAWFLTIKEFHVEFWFIGEPPQDKKPAQGSKKKKKHFGDLLLSWKSHTGARRALTRTLYATVLSTPKARSRLRLIDYYEAESSFTVG